MLLFTVGEEVMIDCAMSYCSLTRSGNITSSCKNNTGQTSLKNLIRNVRHQENKEIFHYFV